MYLFSIFCVCKIATHNKKTGPWRHLINSLDEFLGKSFFLFTAVFRLGKFSKHRLGNLNEEKLLIPGTFPVVSQNRQLEILCFENFALFRRFPQLCLLDLSPRRLGEFVSSSSRFVLVSSSSSRSEIASNSGHSVTCNTSRWFVFAFAFVYSTCLFIYANNMQMNKNFECQMIIKAPCD